jgi:Cu(I)/Ag(I) efflux system membrane fusion protein
MPLFRISGLESVWVNARIPEAQRSLAVVGSQVEAKAVAWPGLQFAGKLIAVQPQVDADSRTVTARILLPNREQRLAPGMFVTLDIVAAEQRPQLVVPDEAVITTGERNVVITADAKGMFTVAPVIAGASQDGHTVIMEGLKEGQAIVLSGQFLIDSEASLKSTVARLEATPSAEASTAPAASTEPAAHLAEGTIKSITGGVVTISHGPVPSMQWPAMTMGFRAPASGVPKDLMVGDRVSFSFVEAKGVYQITGITRLEQGGAMDHHP